MADEIGLTEAARALREHFGDRLEATHSEGAGLMAEVLAQRFNISLQQGRRLVEQLERANSIRWVRAGTTDAAPTLPANPTGNIYSSGTPAGGSPFPIPIQGSYWQL